MCLVRSSGSCTDNTWAFKLCAAPGDNGGEHHQWLAVELPRRWTVAAFRSAATWSGPGNERLAGAICCPVIARHITAFLLPSDEQLPHDLRVGFSYAEMSLMGLANKSHHRHGLVTLMRGAAKSTLFSSFVLVEMGAGRSTAKINLVPI